MSRFKCFCRDVIYLIERCLWQNKQQRCIENYNHSFKLPSYTDSTCMRLMSGYVVMWRPLGYRFKQTEMVYDFFSGKSQCLLPKNY
jgi:hypothetical protein